MITTEQWLLKQIEIWQNNLNEAQTEQEIFCATQELKQRRLWLAQVRANQAKKGKT